MCVFCVVGIYEKGNECIDCDVGSIVKEGIIVCIFCSVGIYVKDN